MYDSTDMPLFVLKGNVVILISGILPFSCFESSELYFFGNLLIIPRLFHIPLHFFPFDGCQCVYQIGKLILVLLHFGFLLLFLYI